jgi:signal transduction histidine kinase/CheY-like chemotaxis protein
MSRHRRPFLLRGPSLIILGGFALAFLSALGTVAGIWSSREIALREWENRLTSVARMLLAHADQSFTAADLVLQGVADKVHDYSSLDTADMQWAFRSRYMFDLLRESARGLPQIDAVSVVASDGTLLNTSRQFPAAQIDLSDREYIQIHKANPLLGIFISRPVIGRASGQWAIYLSRKIVSETGEMLGLVQVGFRPEFFSDFYASVAEGLGISLLRNDGAVLVEMASGTPEFSTGQSDSLLRQLKATGHGSALISGDGLKTRAFTQMIALETSARMPLALGVSAQREALLREWESETISLVIIGGSMTAILIAATLLLARLVRKLETARNDAQVAGEARMRFASSVSHELRTPMNAIIGGTHQLMLTGLTPESRQYTGIVASAAQQLMVLINDILDYSSYEARKFKIEPAPFDLRIMVDEMLQMTKAISTDKNLTISAAVSPHAPTMLEGDSGRIRQVLLNLLANAVKYTDAGAVRLLVNYRPDTTILSFAVEDTGRGISSEEIAYIFEPFERGRMRVARQGTGLGLAICKTLVEAMNGKLSVENVVYGTGSRFIFELPAPQVWRAPVTVQENEPPSVKPMRALDILIAEDVAPNRILLTMMLEKWGHRIVAVENGRKAVEHAAAQKFDLVLMDLQMPELDGQSATRRIRAMEKRTGQRMQIVAISANADLEEQDALRKAGFDDALMKPVLPARLEAIVNDIAAQV